MKNKSGFTLVELLVVISIIALLMSILMPSLAKVRKQAQAVVCQANSKQIGLTVSMYLEDNNNSFWEGQFNKALIPPDLADTAYGYWVNRLRPYFSNELDMIVCPSATKRYDEGGTVTCGAWYYDNESNFRIAGEYGSMGVNLWITNPPKGYGNRGENVDYWRKLTSIRGKLNEIPVVMDCRWIDALPHFGNQPPRYRGEKEEGYTGQMGRFCIDRHNGEINGLFMDSSVRRVGLKELWGLKWYRRYNTGYVPRWPDWMKNMPGPN